VLHYHRSLVGQALAGTIPAQITALTKLHTINLANNSIKGGLPAMSAMAQLRTL
jgi:hypothetical protein